MKLFDRIVKALQNLSPAISPNGSIWNLYGPIRESYPGAWQRGVTVDRETNLLAFSAIFACVTGIAADIAKNRLKLDRENDGIYEEVTENSPWLGVLRKPNGYQTRIKFIEQWIISKLLYGNAYILKERRDGRGLVTALYVLNPLRVKPLIGEDGSIYYQVQADYLSGVQQEITVPASEIIHDMMVSLWHPLIGVSPIYACSVSGTMGNRIQQNSTTFFGNLSRPGGMLSAPGFINDDTAKRLKEYWEANFSGANVGRIAVGGDGLAFIPFTMPATDAQLIEQLKWTVEDVGRAFHYPIYKLGGPLPPYSSSPEALTMMYYTDCLQGLIESLELCLDEGLELPPGTCVELDLDNLMRMDTAALYEANNKAVGGGWMAPNEARYRANLGKTTGGDSPMIQQQNYSLEALAKRDAQADPFASKTPAVPPAPVPPAPPKGLALDEIEAMVEYELRKDLAA